MAADTTDTDDLLDLLFAHKLPFIKELLRAHEIPVSGSKPELREKLSREIGRGSLGQAAILSYLDQIEGWGNQHVFLYKSPNQQVQQTWRNETKVKEILRENRCLGLLNKDRPVLLPDKPTISRINWTPGHLRIVWTLKRTWEERLQSSDEESEDEKLIWRAYARKKARGTLAFDWHLGSGEAMVMIQRLPSGTKYEEERDMLTNMMSGLVDINDFQPVRLSQAIKAINESDEVRARKIVLDTPAGGGASFRSSGKGRSVADDPDLRQAEVTVAGNSIGNLGNYYWLKGDHGQLDRDFHVTLHAKDQRVGLFGERYEREVRYVIGRIRSYC